MYTAEKTGQPASFSSLPFHVQTLSLATAGACLTTCKASAALAQDAHLTAQWLLEQHLPEPLERAARHQLWDVCHQLLATFGYQPTGWELCGSLIYSGMYGQAALMSRLLQWSCQEQHPMCGLCYSVSDALSSAASGGHVGVATLLLSHPSCTAQAVRNAVCSAACFRQLQVLNILVDGRPDAGNPKLRGSPMSNAAGHGDIAAMEVLVQHGADVNGSKGSPWQEDAEDHPPFRCPLWIAAYHGHVAAVAWLLQQGITAEGSGLGLALRESAKTADATLVRVLLSYSPTQAALPMHGPSVLLTAVRNSHIAVVEELLKAGVPTTTQAFQQMYRKGDVCDLIRNHLPSHEQVPAFLQSAIKHGHMEFAQLLREAMD